LFKAVLHRNNDLKVAAMEFIAKNFAQVKETPTWNEMKKNPNSTEVLQEIVEYLTKVKTT
jgi:hypothetical protein